MSFIADKQTLDDLNLLGRFKSDSIYSLFNKIKTRGGERLLEEMFKYPMTDPKPINDRVSILKYFQTLHVSLPFNDEEFSAAENFLGMYGSANIFAATLSILRKKMAASLLRDADYGTELSGLRATIQMLQSLECFLGNIDIDFVQEAKVIFEDKRLRSVLDNNKTGGLSVLEISKFEYILRRAMAREMKILLDVVYQLDVYIAVSTVAIQKELYYAEALDADQNIFETSALWHPAVNGAVANPLALSNDKNVIFLTGANMAGKSTLMKSFGIAVYLAHMGFPVAAKDLKFSVRDGLYSSINVADNLNMGYSHFYAEVLRVKTVAQTVSSGKRMIVIFDELFKGTNVKDAYDATLAVTLAFAKYDKCCFIISTHIIEVGTALGDRCTNITFSYLPTIIEGSVPRYTYKIKEGITNDRQGMMIIRNEGIIEMINKNKDDKEHTINVATGIGFSNSNVAENG